MTELTDESRFSEFKRHGFRVYSTRAGLRVTKACYEGTFKVGNKEEREAALVSALRAYNTWEYNNRQGGLKRVCVNRSHKKKPR